MLNRDAWGKILARCREDDAFKARLLANQAATLAAEGMEILEGVTVLVVAESPVERVLVVPCALPPGRIVFPGFSLPDGGASLSRTGGDSCTTMGAD